MNVTYTDLDVGNEASLCVLFWFFQVDATGAARQGGSLGVTDCTTRVLPGAVGSSFQGGPTSWSYQVVLPAVLPSSQAFTKEGYI